jgi:hypothetical protein
LRMRAWICRQSAMHEDCTSGWQAPPAMQEESRQERGRAALATQEAPEA